MRALSRWKILPLLAVGWLVLAGAASAALVSEVQDKGDFFSPEAIQKANKLIKEIKQDFNKDLVVETYPALPASKLDEFKKVENDREAKERFYEEWARQRAKDLEVNGVYIMLIRQPGHLQIEVGNETAKKAFTMADRKKLGEGMLGKLKKAFSTKDPAEQKKVDDEMLLDTVKFVGRTMKDNGAGKRSEAVPVGPKIEDHRAQHTPYEAGPAAATPNKINWGGIICIGLVVVLVVWVLIAIVRAITGAGRGYGPGGGMGGGMGGPGYGYGGGGGGGGFLTGMLGGLFGAAAGSFLYDRFFRGDSMGGGLGGSAAYGAGPSGGAGPTPQDTDYSGGGGDFGGDAGGGGGGGDFGGGGGDFGGGGGGGGDFGGGGGDFGGGGGDFGGGGGDFGGGVGDF